MVLNKTHSYWSRHQRPITPGNVRISQRAPLLMALNREVGHGLGFPPAESANATDRRWHARDRFDADMGHHGPMSFLLGRIIDLLVLLFVARALLSWFNFGPSSPFRPLADGVYRVTEPVLAPVRRALPPMGGIDVSVLLVILVLRFFVRPLLT